MKNLLKAICISAMVIASLNVYASTSFSTSDDDDVHPMLCQVWPLCHPESLLRTDF